MENSALLPATPWRAHQPGGDGRSVMLLPGFCSDDRAPWPLRSFLSCLGYSALPWGLGRDQGQPEQDADPKVWALIAQTLHRSQEAPQDV